MPSRSGGVTSTGSGLRRWGRSGTTRTRSRTSRSSRACSERSSSPRGQGSAAMSTWSGSRTCMPAGVLCRVAQATCRSRSQPAAGRGCESSTPTTGSCRSGSAAAPTRSRLSTGPTSTGPRPSRGRRWPSPRAAGSTSGCRCPRQGAAVRVEMGGAALVLGPAGSSLPATRAPSGVVDLLTYGSPAPLAFDPTSPDRRFVYSIGRRPGFLNGNPACTGPSTARLSRPRRCSWCPRATSR